LGFEDHGSMIKVSETFIGRDIAIHGLPFDDHLVEFVSHTTSRNDIYNIL